MLRLPGRALADDRTIWLCNAQYAESSVFSRSLLAKVGLLLVEWEKINNLILNSLMPISSSLRSYR